MQSSIVEDRLLDQWIREALTLSDDQFSPIEPLMSLLIRPLQESKGACSIFLKPEFDPHRGASGVRWFAHTGNIDVLRARYAAANLQCTSTETINFVFVQVGPTPSNDRHAFLQNLIRTVLKTDTAGHHWEFDLPSEVEGPWRSLLISNRGAPPLVDMQSRHDRMDLLLWNEIAYFLAYKKVDQLEGFQRLDSWFSPEAREAIRRRQPKN